MGNANTIFVSDASELRALDTPSSSQSPEASDAHAHASATATAGAPAQAHGADAPAQNQAEAPGALDDEPELSPTPTPVASPPLSGPLSGPEDDAPAAAEPDVPTGRHPSVAQPSPYPVSLSGPPAKLVMLGPDGQPVGERTLTPGESLEIGREVGPPWDDDAYLDPQHASIAVTNDGLLIEDNASLNGVFVKLSERVEVQDGDLFRVGQELLLYEDLPEPTPTDDGTERMGSPNPGYWGRLSILVDPDAASTAFPIEGDGIMVGREHGDITFPHDGYVSGKHCRVVGDDTGVYMEDLGSSNGTYMRVRSGVILPFGSLVLIGQKLFQVERLD